MNRRLSGCPWRFKRKGAVDEDAPQVKIEAQRGPLLGAFKSREGVHVERHRVADDLLEEFLTDVLDES